MKALRVLIVEDDPMLGTMLAEILESIGHSVCGIEPTEDKAVATAFRCRPDLMIVDVRLREGNGVNAVRRISLSDFVPHVFVSGGRPGLKTVRKNAVILQKPYRVADLVSAMARAITLLPE